MHLIPHRSSKVTLRVMFRGICTPSLKNASPLVSYITKRYETATTAIEKQPKTLQTPKVSLDFPKFCRAVGIFNQIYGNPWIGYDIIIEHGDFNWPEEYWGYDLGSAMRAYRELIYYKSVHDKFAAEPDYQILLDVKFIPRNRHQYCLLLIESLKVYKALHYHDKVPQKYIIPKEKIFEIEKGSNLWIKNPYPRGHWGYALGLAVRNQIFLKQDSYLFKNMVLDILKASPPQIKFTFVDPPAAK